MTARGAARRPLSLPPVIGHRGASAYAPENTLAGFHAARALGCSWVEFDVRLTGDGALAVSHDDRLGRTTDGRGRISGLALSAIRKLDAGRWFSDKFAGERVPTLEEAIRVCGEIGLGANVEIKAERGRGPATAAAVAAYLDSMAEILPPILISSFLPDAIAEAGARAPAIPRGVLFKKIPRGWRDIAAKLGCTTIHAGHADLDESLAAEIGDAGYPLLAYTVNDAERARQLFGWGVASVFSDVPDIMLLAAAEAWAASRKGVVL
ncbi:MAG TPA: glycerophosphoryl diester phosphodiesterase [Stellaceae bacterium]|nr:glycerophosphoryl diester phosphodiesterase [Stellaceae bacterium]